MIIQTPALVLKRFPYGDTSLIARCFARETGKLSVIAKGARRKGSPLAAGFQPLGYLALIYYHKDSREIQTVSSIDIIESWQNFSDDLVAVSMALAVLEITDKTLPEYDPHPNLFDILVAVIRAFDQNTAPKNLLFWYYQLRVLSTLGFMPDIDDLEAPETAQLKQAANSHALVAELLAASLDNLPDRSVTAVDKKTINNFLFDQFRRHFEGFDTLKSLKVLRQLVML